jgi:hypothetical protein
MQHHVLLNGLTFKQLARGHGEESVGRVGEYIGLNVSTEAL